VTGVRQPFIGSRTTLNKSDLSNASQHALFNLICVPYICFRIVGFYVEPLSVKHTFASGSATTLTTCTQPSASSKHLDYDSVREKMKMAPGNLVFTYGVEWRKSDVKWASRWDVYLSRNHAVSDNVHWFSIINSLLIVLFLSFMVGMILYRTLSHDINKYNKVSKIAVQTNACVRSSINFVASIKS